MRLPGTAQTCRRPVQDAHQVAFAAGQHHGVFDAAAVDHQLQGARQAAVAGEFAVDERLQLLTHRAGERVQCRRGQVAARQVLPLSRASDMISVRLPRLRLKELRFDRVRVQLGRETRCAVWSAADAQETGHVAGRVQNSQRTLQVIYRPKAHDASAV